MEVGKVPYFALFCTELINRNSACVIVIKCLQVSSSSWLSFKSRLLRERSLLKQCPLLFGSDRSLDLKGSGASQFPFVFLCKPIVSISRKRLSSRDSACSVPRILRLW